MLESRESEKKRQRLLEIIREKSYREGDFTLASGKKSSFYLDLKETTLSQEGMLLVGALACDWLKKQKWQVHAVGGMTLGADPIAVAVAFEAGKRGMPLQAFIVRKEPKGHGTARWLEGTKTFPENAPVLVVEDVVTTGGSSLKAIQAIREAGFRVQGLLTVVDREEGGASAFQQAGVDFFSLCRLHEVRGKTAG